MVAVDIPDITLTIFEVPEIDLIIQSATNDGNSEDEPENSRTSPTRRYFVISGQVQSLRIYPTT
jgi:hypothetical protein